MLSLSDLVSKLPSSLAVEGNASQLSSIDINGITSDSSQVKPGSLFAAIQGVSRDGAEFIPQAIEAGAAAVLTRQGVSVPEGVAHLTAENDRLALSKLAAAFYGPQPEHVVAITGTDGKTSTAEFFRQLIGATGDKAASLGTLGLRVSGKVKLNVSALNTSPDPVLLHQTLQALEQQECNYVALEASSHGLDQFRLDGVKLSAAAFTSFARDHMDYHKTEADYFAAKLRLFRFLLPRGGRAVIYDKLKYASDIKKAARLRKLDLVTYGETGDLMIRQLERLPQGMQVRLNLHGQRVETELGLIGDFQLLNILAAFGLAEGCGKDAMTLVAELGRMQPVRGRLERAAVLENGAGVYVDYAHTPAALQKVLEVLRHHCTGKLAVVFGCGGDRDKGKRPLMGKVASELADRVYVTDDNPRSENPDVIRQEVEAGCVVPVHSIADRKKAIAEALSALEPGDVLLIAGKGHEDYQIIGDQKLPFDDVQVVKALVGGK